MADNMFAPVRMESNFLDSALHTVIYQAANADAAVEDGALVVLGDFTNEPTYSAAYTAGNGGVATNVVDINTRYATAPAAATATGLCVIDLPDVPTFTNGREVIRMGVDVIGLAAEAGHWVRARKLAVDDTFHIGADNIEGDDEATVGQFLTATAGKTTWTPSDTAPTSGFYAKVVGKESKSRGISRPFTQYFCVVMAN